MSHHPYLDGCNCLFEELYARLAVNGLPVPEPAVVVAPGGVLGVMVEGEATAAAAAAMEAVVVCVQGMGRVVPPLA